MPEDLQTAIGKLMPFSNQASADQKADNPERTIPYEIRDYLELVDWSGRAVVEGKQRTRLYGEDARPSETPWTRGLAAPQ